MEWDFTPEDVRTGKSHYSVTQSREDLLEEIKENIEMLKAVIRRRIQDDTAIGIEPDCITKTITSELMTF